MVVNEADMKVQYDLSYSHSTIWAKSIEISCVLSKVFCVNWICLAEATCIRLRIIKVITQAHYGPTYNQHTRSYDYIASTVIHAWEFDRKCLKSSHCYIGDMVVASVYLRRWIKCMCPCQLINLVTECVDNGCSFKNDTERVNYAMVSVWR